MQHTHAVLALPPPVPDSLYNLDLVSFRVGNAVFRVPKQAFDVEGTIFKDMFALPAPVSEIQEGSSNDNPIYLEGVEEGDFRALVRVLLPLRGQPPVTEFKEWIEVLTLSTLWHFMEIRAEAIEAISKKMDGMSVLQRIHLGRKYNNEKWVEDAYIELLNKQTLMLDELFGPSLSYRLDWSTIAKIFYIRDNRDYFKLPSVANHDGEPELKHYGWNFGFDGPNYQHIDSDPNAATKEVINKVFGEEFKDLQMKAVV